MTTENYRGAEQRIEKLTFALGVLGVAFTFWHWGWKAALGLAVGAGISWINFRWLKTGISTLANLTVAQTGDQPARVPRTVYLKVVGRFVLLLVTVYVILSRSLLPPAALLAGLFAIVAAVLTELVYEIARGGAV
jgi:small-conductance mechanosensitive channel